MFHYCPPNTLTIGRHKPVICAVLSAYYTVVLWCRDNRPSHASYLGSFAGMLHRCTLAPVNRPSHASRETGVAYLIGEVNCRCFSCMQRVVVGVCFRTLLGAWYWVFSSCAYMWFSHMRKNDPLCASGSFQRYGGACFVMTCSITMASSITFERLLRFSSGYNRPLSNIFGHLIWCHILCVFDLSLLFNYFPFNLFRNTQHLNASHPIITRQSLGTH